MSEIQNHFVVSESQRLEKIRQQIEGPGEEAEVAGGPLSDASLITGPLQYIFGSVGGDVLQTVAAEVFPNHPVIQQVAGILGGMAGGIKSPKGESSAISEEVKQTLGTQPVQAKLDEAIKETAARAQKFLNASGKKDLEAKLTRFQKVLQTTGNTYTALIDAQLMNPRITAEKLLTDALFLPTQIAFRGIGTVISHGPTAGVKTISAGLYAYRESFKDALKYAFSSFGRDEPTFQESLGLGKEGVYSIEHFDESPTAGMFRWIGSIYGAGRKSVMSTDQFSKAIAWRAEARMNSYIEALDEADKHGLIGAAKNQFANRYAEYLVNNMSDALFEKTKQKMFADTFTDQSKLSKELSSFANNHLWARLMVPYIRTPMNLMKQGIFLSPLAPLTTAFREDVMGSPIDRNVALAKWGFGSAISVWIAHEVAEGNITGNGPEGRGRVFWPGRDHPHSIKIAGEWFDYSHLGPFAAALSLSADATEMYHLTKDPGQQDKIVDTIFQMLNSYADHAPFLESISNMLHAIQSGAEGGGKKGITEFLGREASGFIPAPVRIAAHVEDPALRDAKTVLDQIKTNIPYYSQTLPLKYDVFGESIYPPVAVSDGHLMSKHDRLLNTLSPVPVYSDTQFDDVEQEFNKHQMSFNAIPDHLSFSPESGMPPVPISEWERAEWAQNMGKKLDAGAGMNFHDFTEMVIKQPSYRNSSPMVQRHTLTSIHTGFVQASQEEMLKNHPEIQNQIQNNAIKAAQLAGAQ